MKTVLDFIIESEAASNVVSSGAIATTTPPIGELKKRKPATVESVGTDPLATVYATENPEVTGEDADAAEKRMFHFRQQSQNDC